MNTMQGHIIMIIGPSCSGKDTVFKQLLNNMPALKPIIQYTTREPRNDETNGVDYNFVTREEFDKLNVIDPRHYDMINTSGENTIVSYGSALESFDKNDLEGRTHNTYILISTLEGLQKFNMVEQFKGKIIPIFLNCSVDNRVARYIERIYKSGQLPTYNSLREVIRRIDSDNEQFSIDKVNKMENLITVDANRPIGQVITDIKHIIADNISKEEIMILLNSILEKVRV